MMHPYRTHTCGQLRSEHAGQEVRLAGWVHRKRKQAEDLLMGAPAKLSNKQLRELNIDTM